MTTQCLTEMTEEFAEYRNQKANEEEFEFDQDLEDATDDEVVVVENGIDEYVESTRDVGVRHSQGSYQHQERISDKTDDHDFHSKVEARKRELEAEWKRNGTLITNVTKQNTSPSRHHSSYQHSPPINSHQTESFIKHKIQEIHQQELDDEFEMVDHVEHTGDRGHSLRTLPRKNQARTTAAAAAEPSPSTQEVGDNDRRAALREAWVNLASQS